MEPLHLTQVICLSAHHTTKWAFDALSLSPSKAIQKPNNGFVGKTKNQSKSRVIILPRSRRNQSTHTDSSDQNPNFSIMQPNQTPPDSDLPLLAAIKVKSSSPRFPPPTPTDTPTANAQRRIGIAVDLSDESAFAVKWSVHHYLRPGDAVILLHVRPTSVLYGADWGAVDVSVDDQESQQKLENEFDTFTVTKSTDLAQPLVDAGIPFKIHIVKDHDMKERICLEVERLGLSAVIMGSRGVGARKRGSSGGLGSVSDYCVRHCVCPVVVVRFPDDEKDVGLESMVEEESEFHDAADHRKDT